MNHEYWIEETLRLAKQAAHEGEVPIGALIIDQEGEPVSSAYNQTIQLIDPCAHAEILAIRQAAEKLKNYRLLHTTLYVSLEPCAMCAGAIIQARIPKIVFAAPDLRAGALQSVFQLLDHPSLNHRAEVVGGIRAQESAEILQRFFRAKRYSASHV